MKQINQTAPALPQLNNPFLPPAGKTAAIKVELKTENFAFTQPGFLQRAVGYEQGGGGEKREGLGGWAGVSGCAGEVRVSEKPLLHLS